MNEPLITFETAKSAREKGFTGTFWTENYFHVSNKTLSRGMRAETFDSVIHIPAHTQSLLQKWLRDKYNINCRVASNSLSYHFAMIEILEVDGTRMCGPKEMKIFKTYEEALELGLQEALKLI